MNIDEFNSLEKELENNTNKNHEKIHEFFTELKQCLENFTLKEDKIFAIRDIIDNKISLVNIDNGEDLVIYIVTNEEEEKKLNDSGIVNNIYKMSKEEFYCLDLGKGLKFKNGISVLNKNEFKINNGEAKAKLEDMYFSLEQENGKLFEVLKKSEGKIYVTNKEEGGYFSVPEGKYPYFKVGDILKNENGKFILIK